MQDPSFTRQYYENMIDATMAPRRSGFICALSLEGAEDGSGRRSSHHHSHAREQKDQLAFARSMPGGFMRALAYDGLDDTDLIRIGAMNGAVESWAK